MILISKYGYILKAFLLDRHIIFNNEARKKRLVHYRRLLKYLNRSNFIYISFYISIQNSLAGTIGTVQSSTHNHKQTSPPLSPPPNTASVFVSVFGGGGEKRKESNANIFFPLSFRTSSNFIMG